MPVLLRHYCTNVMYIPLNFFNDASVWMEDNILYISVSCGYGFLKGNNFEQSLSDFIFYLTDTLVNVKLEKSRVESRPKIVLPPPVVHKEAPKKTEHRDFKIDGLDIKEDSVKVFMGKYIQPKNMVSI